MLDHGAKPGLITQNIILRYIKELPPMGKKVAKRGHNEKLNYILSQKGITLNNLFPK